MLNVALNGISTAALLITSNWYLLEDDEKEDMIYALELYNEMQDRIRAIMVTKLAEQKQVLQWQIKKGGGD